MGENPAPMGRRGAVRSPSAGVRRWNCAAPTTRFVASLPYHQIHGRLLAHEEWQGGIVATPFVALRPAMGCPQRCRIRTEREAKWWEPGGSRLRPRRNPGGFSVTAVPSVRLQVASTHFLASVPSRRVPERGTTSFPHILVTHHADFRTRSRKGQRESAPIDPRFRCCRVRHHRRDRCPCEHPGVLLEFPAETSGDQPTTPAGDVGDDDSWPAPGRRDHTRIDAVRPAKETGLPRPPAAAEEIANRQRDSSCPRPTGRLDPGRSDAAPRARSTMPRWGAGFRMEQRPRLRPVRAQRRRVLVRIANGTDIPQIRRKR